MSGRRMRDCFAIGLLLGIAILGLWSATGSAAAVGGSQESLENASDEMDGEGTVDNPYEIRTTMQLRAIEVAPEAHYVLAADIDANLSAEWETGSGFQPIERFAGTLDGRGHTIENLTIDIAGSRAGIIQNNSGTISNITIRSANVSRYGVNTVSVEPAGTIAGKNHGRITNVDVVDSRVHNDGFAGGLVGYNVGGTILNSTIRNTSVSLDSTTVPSSAGGLVGRLINGTVADVAILDGTVRAPEETGGGLVGIAEGASVRNSYVRGTVSGAQAGGVFGVGVDLTVREVFSSGTIEGTYYAGGITGRFVAATMENAGTVGRVSADETAGGLVGAIETSYDDGILDTTVTGEPISSISSSYGATVVQGEAAGGIAGDINTSQSEPLFENVYWDSTRAGDVGIPGSLDYAIRSRTTDELTGNTAPANMFGFNFQTVWTDTVRYPVLRSHIKATLSNRTVFGENELEVVNERLEGAGTAAEPFVITSAIELQSIAATPDAQYVLDNDIDASATRGWGNLDQGFRPIDEFSGSLDGQGHTINALYMVAGDRPGGITRRNTGEITNLTLDRADIHRGAFASMATFLTVPAGPVAGYNYGHIRNVTVVNSSMHNEGPAGGLVGYNAGGTIAYATIRNVTVEQPEIIVRTAVGGLVGLDNGTVSNSVVRSTTVRSPNGTGGGGVGIKGGGTLENTSVDAAVSAESGGGILGISLGGELNQVTVTGTVEGRSHAGGVVGRLVGGEIRNVATTASVTAETAGGIVGIIETEYEGGYSRYYFSDVGSRAPSMQSSYAATVATGERVGGVAGEMNTTGSDAIFEGVYWDATKGSDGGAPGGDDLAIIPLSTGEMTGDNASAAMPALDFDTTWTTSESYPALRTQTRAIEANMATGELETTLVRSGESATLLLQLTNPSQQRQIYRSDLRFGEEVVGPVTATLAAGEQREVTFDWNVTGVRTAPVTVGGLTVGSLTVVDDTTVSLESVDSPERVAVGEEYSVTATVMNEATETLEIPLTHRTEAGETTERFGLEPGENSITFPTTRDEAGTVEHEVSFLNATVETMTSVLEPARFSIANIEAPETVEIDESFEVTVTINNDGGFDGEKSVSIGPSGAPYLAESMNLEAGAEDQLTATGTAAEAGNLEIVVETPDETETVEVTVEESSPSSQSGDSGTHADEDGVGFGLLTAALSLVTIAVVARRYGR